MLKGALATPFLAEQRPSRVLPHELFRLKEDCVVLFETESAFKPDADQHLNKIYDRSFLPQYLKALLLYEELFPGMEESLPDRIEQAVELLLNNRKEGVAAWDRYAQEGDFAIYQTERAIEALCRYIEFVTPSSAQQAQGNEHNLSVVEIPVSLDALSQVMKGVAPLIAETVARRAVTLNVNGKAAESLIKRQVEQAWREQRAGFTEELQGILTEVHSAFTKQAKVLVEALGSGSDMKATEKTIDDFSEEFRRMNEKLFKAEIKDE